MKGPGIRLDLDVRRVWECPLCNKRQRAGGEAVALRCGCTRDRAIMQLVENRRLTRSFVGVIERVQQASAAADQQKQSRKKKQQDAEEQAQAESPQTKSDPPADNDAPAKDPQPAEPTGKDESTGP